MSDTNNQPDRREAVKMLADRVAAKLKVRLDDVADDSEAGVQTGALLDLLQRELQRASEETLLAEEAAASAFLDLVEQRLPALERRTERLTQRYGL